MANNFTISAKFADGRTLTEFADTLKKRMKYLNETAFQSIHALAIETLKSIRGLTKVARPNSIKVKLLERSDLQLSYFTEGGYKKLCIRTRSGIRLVHNSIGRFIYSPTCKGAKTKDIHVFEFVDEFDKKSTKYLICSSSKGDATKLAKKAVANRALRYAGLARRAISALMVKTNTKGPADNVGAHVYAKANEVTSSRNFISRNQDGSGKYTLVLDDSLRYAMRAVKGGSAAVDMAMKRASNKAIGLIRNKCQNLLLPGELKTPFPEIVKKKAA